MAVAPSATAAKVREHLDAGIHAPTKHRVGPHTIRRARVAATAVLQPVARRRFHALGVSGDARLHLGSGFVYKRGWTNVDLAGARVDISWGTPHRASGTLYVEAIR
jgi:hypothetical protein